MYYYTKIVVALKQGADCRQNVTAVQTWLLSPKPRVLVKMVRRHQELSFTVKKCTRRSEGHLL
jgi:hypothetical protein